VTRHRSNRNKYLFIAILLVAAVIVAAFAFNQGSSQKPLASQYFVVTHTTSAGEYLTSDNKTVRLTTLGLNITAVGGDATNVQVFCNSQAEPESDYLVNLTRGAPGWDLPIALAGGQYNYRGLSLRMNDQGMFALDVTISCDQVKSAKIPVLINPEDIVLVPITPN
jgi:hypothetical protein